MLATLTCGLEHVLLLDWRLTGFEILKDPPQVVGNLTSLGLPLHQRLSFHPLPNGLELPLLEALALFFGTLTLLFVHLTMSGYDFQVHRRGAWDLTISHRADPS
jgi:hypothetical protein